MSAHADRLPPLPPSEWTAEQARYAQEVIDGPRKALISPFVPLLRSPELMGHAQRMGEYLRYRSQLGMRLSEFAILITARHWTQQVEWAIHAPIALQHGISPDTVEALRVGRLPRELPADEAAVHGFCIELLEHHSVCDATWAEAVGLFGEAGVMDLIGITGYYAFLSMVMNAARTTVPASTAAPLPPFACVMPAGQDSVADVIEGVVGKAGGKVVEGARHLDARVDIAGLQKTWVEFPDEVREACALARVYVDMLPAEVAPGIAPWTFPTPQVAA
jgi:4-carboxymuconolactone decarboxylase